MELYVWWFIAALVLIIIEMLTAGFAVICFAIGAFCAAIVDLCGASLNWQLITMAVCTFLAFILVRPLALKYLNKKKNDVPTNIDALIGRTGKVSETIDSRNNTGRVSIDGDEWKAVTQDDSIIEKGQKVKIIARESLIVTVE